MDIFAYFLPKPSFSRYVKIFFIQIKKKEAVVLTIPSRLLSINYFIKYKSSAAFPILFTVPTHSIWSRAFNSSLMPYFSTIWCIKISVLFCAPCIGIPVLEKYHIFRWVCCFIFLDDKMNIIFTSYPLKGFDITIRHFIDKIPTPSTTSSFTKILPCVFCVTSSCISTSYLHLHVRMLR